MKKEETKILFYGDISKNHKEKTCLKEKHVMRLSYLSHAKRVAERSVVNDLMKKKEK